MYECLDEPHGRNDGNVEALSLRLIFDGKFIVHEDEALRRCRQVFHRFNDPDFRAHELGDSAPELNEVILLACQDDRSLGQRGGALPLVHSPADRRVFEAVIDYRPSGRQDEGGLFDHSVPTATLDHPVVRQRLCL